jgi:hypothetical protein
MQQEQIHFVAGNPNCEMYDKWRVTNQPFSISVSLVLKVACTWWARLLYTMG